MAATKAALAYAFALLGVMVVIAPSAFAGDADLKKQVDQIASLCVEIFNKQDAAGVAALFATNAIAVNPSGPQTDVFKPRACSRRALTIAGPLDTMKPNLLICEPFGKELKCGRRRVAGVTDLRDQAKADAVRPVVHEAMEGDDPFIPQQFVNYDLHAWIFKPNPIGTFAATNPDVKCEGYDHALLEPPTKHVHPGGGGGG